MLEDVSRRRFLELSGAATLSAWVGAGCGTTHTAAHTASHGSSLGSITWQLGWLKDGDYIGSYEAQVRGYYRQNGINVDIVAGGPNIDGLARLVQGAAFVTDDQLSDLVTANQHGASLRVVATRFPDGLFGIASPASKPILSPHAMIGKTIAVAGSNSALWTSFLKFTGVPSDKVTTVPYQGDPTLLASGTVDGLLAYYTDDMLPLHLKGIYPQFWFLSKVGYRETDGNYMVQSGSLQGSERAKLRAFLRSEIQGWHAVMRDQPAAVKLDVNDFARGQGLNPRSEAADIAACVKYSTAGPRTHRFLSISPADQQGVIKSLAAAGQHTTASEVFDLSVVDEIYSQDPGLRVTPT